MGDLLRLPPGAVEVAVSDGIVHLGGKVPLRSQALALEKMTRAVDGVVEVETKVTWGVDDTVMQPAPSEPAPLM